MAPRPCVNCGTPTTTTRCPRCEQTHQRARNTQPTRDKYRGTWPRQARQAIAQHQADHGDWCPGYGIPQHRIHPNQWTCDHHLGPLCRSCNSRKGATADKQAAAQLHPHP